MNVAMKPAILLGLAALVLQAATPIAARAQDKLALAVGQRGSWDTAVAEIGWRAGIFKKHGLELDILYTSGSGETQQAVIAGSAQIGVAVGVMGVLGAYAKGAPVRVIGAEQTGLPDMYFYVLAASPIRTIADTAGKTIAYSTNGASTHSVVTALIKQSGVAAKPVATGNQATTLTQVMSGQVDVGWSSPPFGIGPAREGKIRIIARGNELPYFREQTIRLIVANAGYLAKNKDVAARFIQAYRDTLEWMYGDPAGLKAYAAFAKTDENTAKQVRDVFYPKQGLMVDHISGLDAVMADGIAYKYLSALLSKEQLAELFQVPSAAQ
jgi:NitT/TauT family transport system substrate-binding protein